MESEKDLRKTSDEAPEPALNSFQGRLLLPALTLGALFFLSVLSVGLVLADQPDTVRAPKPDSAKAVHPDSAATLPQKYIPVPTTGRLTGRVTDVGKGLGIYFAATVIIKGTERGTVTNPDGFYLIGNIPPGKYTVQATVLGYSTDTKKNVKITPGLTTRRDFKIKPLPPILRP